MLHFISDFRSSMDTVVNLGTVTNLVVGICCIRQPIDPRLELKLLELELELELELDDTDGARKRK